MRSEVLLQYSDVMASQTAWLKGPLQQPVLRQHLRQALRHAKMAILACHRLGILDTDTARARSSLVCSRNSFGARRTFSTNTRDRLLLLLFHTADGQCK